MRLKKGQTGNLHIVKTAGLKLNKKDKSVNKKAGLDGKGKTAKGVTKVKRRKPLEIKHVRRMRKAALAIACVGIAGVTAVGLGFFPKSPVEELPDLDYYTVCYEAPLDGTSPLEHSLVENVGYLNYVLQNQPYWSSEMQSTVYTVMQQTVNTYKQYYDGVLISADIAQGVSSEATQFCVADGVVLWRSAANKNFDGMNTAWTTKAPQGLTIPKFKKLRGLPPSEFSVYVLNENTIKNANDYSVIDNGDGTFTMTLELNVNTGNNETSADYYYRQQMYVTGGLDDRPEIKSTTVQYTFDSNWRVLEFSISDSYMAQMVISVPCTSETTTKYYYEEDRAKNTFYEDYFKAYVNNFTEAETPDNSTPSALNYLAAAFASVLDEGATFKLNLGIGELNLDGVVHVGLSNGSVEDIRLKLGDISVFMEQNALYVSDGNAKYKLDTSAFISQAAEEETASSFDLNSLMDQLTGGEFTVTESGAKLDTDLELFGLKITLHFTFEVKDGVVSLGDVKAEIPVGNTAVNATLKFGSESDIPAKPEDISGYTDILNEGIALKTNISIDGLSLSGIIKVIMNEGEFSGIHINLDDLTVYYDCPRNMLYLSDGNVKYKISLDSASGVDLSSILENLDVNSLLSEVIKNISSSKDSISTGATLNILEQTISAVVAVKLTGGISVGANLEVLGHKVTATVGLTNEEVAEPNYDEYVDILNEGLTLAVDINVDGLNLNGLVYIGLENSVLTEVRADLGDIKVYYKNNIIYFTDGNVKYQVAIPASEGIALDFDLNGLLKEIVGSLVIDENSISTNATLNILEQTINAAVSVKLNGGITVGADLEVLGHKVTATVGLTNDEVAEPDYDEYVDILNEGLTLAVDINVDGLNLNGLVYIGLENSVLTEVRADLGDIKVYYKNNVIYFTDGNVKYQVAIPASEGVALDLDLNGLLSEVIEKLTFNKDGIATGATLNILEQTINAAVSVKLNGGISVGADLEVLGHKVKATVGLTNEEVAEPNYDEYVDILNEGITLNVDLTVDGLNLNGLVFIGLENSTLTEVRADLGDIKVYYKNNVIYFTDGNVKYQVAIPASEGVALDLDLNGLLKEIVSNLVISENGISTNATLNILEQTINAAVSVKLNGGISVGADLEVLGHKVTATVGLTNEEVAEPDYDEYVDILNEGITLDVSLTLDEKNIYGDGAIELEGKVFVGLQGGKFTEIRADFGSIAVYYSTLDKDLYIKVGTTKLKVPLNNISGGVAVNVASALPFDTADIIKELIVNLVADAKEISTNASFTILDAIVPVSAKLNLDGGLKAEAQLVLLGINLKAGIAFDTEELPALSLTEKEEYIDAIKNTWDAVESVIGNEIAAQVEGSLYSYDNAKYAQYGYVKYNFNASFEYLFTNDENRSAVNIDFGEVNADGVREGVNFWIDSEVYMHFNLELKATSPLDDSLTLDLLVLDANPAGTTNGVTNGGYTKDNVLDVYLSVSKYSKGNANYDPLMIYAPMDEIMTLVSMAGAVANLDNITFENNAELDKAVKEIANIVNQLLVETYLPKTKNQFSSLGDSLIPQIMGKSLGDFLGEVMENLGVASDGGDEGSAFDISTEYIKDISCGNDSLKLTLNSPAIYGKDMDEDDYLTVQFIKCNGKLDGIYLKNIYFGKDNVNELDIGLKLSYSGVEKPVESDGLKGYRNFEGIDTLLKALVNSATHETEGENAYDLNHYYLLDGDITAKIVVIGIEVKVKINLNSIAVYIDEDNKVSVDAHISYDGVEAAGQVAINGDSEVYLSIKNDMIYLKRIQKTYYNVFGIIATKKTYATPVVEYRAMPLSSFMDDIMNQIVFLFNFGSLVSNNLKGAGEGGTSVSFDGRDLGNTFKYLLNYYIYSETESNATWSFAINGSLMTDLVGMTMSDIPIVFKAEKNDDGTLTVKGLTVVESTMQLWGSAVKLNYSANLNYRNPNECTPDIDDSSVKVNELKEINSLSWDEILGGNSFADIKKTVNWNLLKVDTGLDYIRYGNGADFAVAPLKVKYSTGSENEYFSDWDREQIVLYNSNTKNIYSYYDLPDLDGLMPKIDGKTAVWKNGYEEESGALVIKAIYDTTYKVSVISENPVNDDFVFDGENYVNTVEEAYERVLLPVHVYFDSENGIKYGLKHYIDQNGDICSFTKYALNSYGQLCYVAEVVGEECYTAVWERVYAVTFVAEFDGNVTENTIWYYEGQALSGSVLPTVPAVQGYTGVWDISENTVVTPDTEYTFNAIYTINSYTVTIQSEIETTNGNYVLVDGVYKYSADYNFNELVTLEALTATSPAYVFMGFYDNPEFAGSPVTEFTVWDNVTYYAKWEGKSLFVTYSSDLSFENAKLVDGVYKLKAPEMKYGSKDMLASYSVDGRKTLGWFYQEEDGSYTYIDTAQTLKDKFESSDETNITLHAVWIQDVQVNITKATRSGLGIVSWTIEGDVSFGYVGEESVAIAQSANIKASVICYYAQGSETEIKDNWGDNNTADTNGHFSFKKSSCLVNGDYAYVTATVKYSVGTTEIKSYDVSDKRRR